jgi:hypothetical protein
MMITGKIKNPLEGCAKLHASGSRVVANFDLEGETIRTEYKEE